MIKTKKGLTKIRAKDKNELSYDLVQILITILENDYMTREEITVSLDCAESLKKLYKGEPQVISASELLKELFKGE